MAGRVEMTTCNNLNSYACRSSESMNFDYSQKTQEVAGSLIMLSSRRMPVRTEQEFKAVGAVSFLAIRSK